MVERLVHVPSADQRNPNRTYLFGRVLVMRNSPTMPKDGEALARLSRSS